MSKSSLPGGAVKQTHYQGTTKLVNGNAVWTGRVALAPDHILTAPLRWRRPRHIFVNSMGDLFEPSVPDEWIDQAFAIMALTPNHTYQLLTKRPQRMREYIEKWFERLATTVVMVDHPVDRKNFADLVDWAVLPSVLPNVWVGASVEDQKRADERREDLGALAGKGWRTFVSYEPALGAIDWSGYDFLDWIVSGDESGPGARDSDLDWHRATRDFCQSEGRNIAYFLKQARIIGLLVKMPALDGVVWDQMPDRR